MFTEKDKNIIKQALKELILEDPEIANILKGSTGINTKQSIKQSIEEKRRNELIKIIDEDFIKYEEVFKALA